MRRRVKGVRLLIVVGLLLCVVDAALLLAHLIVASSRLELEWALFEFVYIALLTTLVLLCGVLGILLAEAEREVIRNG